MSDGQGIINTVTAVDGRRYQDDVQSDEDIRDEEANQVLTKSNVDYLLSLQRNDDRKKNTKKQRTASKPVTRRSRASVRESDDEDDVGSNRGRSIASVSRGINKGRSKAQKKKETLLEAHENWKKGPGMTIPNLGRNPQIERPAQLEPVQEENKMQALDDILVPSFQRDALEAQKLQQEIDKVLKGPTFTDNGRIVMDFAKKVHDHEIEVNEMTYEDAKAIHALFSEALITMGDYIDSLISYLSKVQSDKYKKHTFVLLKKSLLVNAKAQANARINSLSMLQHKLGVYIKSVTPYTQKQIEQRNKRRGGGGGTV